MTIGITGHRKFDPNYFNYVKFLEQIIVNKTEAVITGGATGFDIIISDVSKSLQLPLDLYLPYTGFCKRKDLLEYARKILCFYPKYMGNHIYQERNVKIVNDSDILFCYYDDVSKGGSYNTIEYAKSINKEVINFYKI